MRLTSLRSKILLLVGLTVLLSAALVMALTQRGVTSTVYATEEHAIQNVLNLLLQDSEARWGGFLADKIATVRNNRARLVQQGRLVQSVLLSFRAQAENGHISDIQAQALALDWVTHLKAEGGANTLVFDPSHRVLASGDEIERHANLSLLRDYKGRPLANSVYQEVRVSGQAFAIYRLPGEAGAPSQLRYAYVTHVPGWDWVVMITDNAEGVVKQINLRRAETEASIADVLQDLQLAESGFLFILGGDGHLIAPPPQEYLWILRTPDAESGRTLAQTLHDLPPTPDIQELDFHPSDRNGDWRIHSTHFRPLNWTIVAAVPEQDFTRAATALRNQLGLILMGVLALGLVVAGVLSMRLTRPLHELSEFARKLPEQDLMAGQTLPENIIDLPRRRPDEVGRLAAAFAYMDAELREKVARLLEETSSRERLESELNIARDLQQDLLPPPDPALAKRLDLSATMVPAKEVGGDLYHYFSLPDGRLLFAIGDVSDKGMPAALFMAGTMISIRAVAETETDPARIMTRINELLAINNPNLMFVTLIVGVLDLDNGHLEWANAGHSPPCVLTPGGELRLLEGRSGPACGVQEGIPYRKLESRLAPGEVLLGYTDGVTEAVGPDTEQYGEHRLYAVLSTLTGAPSAVVVQAVLDRVHAFADGTPQSDDITLLAIQRLPE